MTDKLPSNLLALFAPRPPLRWIPPSDHAPQDRKTAKIDGLAAFLPQLQEYKETDVYTPSESWLERKDRVKLERKDAQERLLRNGPLSCTGDPLCFDHPFSSPCPTSGHCFRVTSYVLTCVTRQTNLRKIQIFVATRSRRSLLRACIMTAQSRISRVNLAVLVPLSVYVCKSLS